MVLPSFVGIGAQRAATTWAYKCLQEHPEVFIAHQKEVHFFDEQFEKGLDWYQQNFAAASGQKAVGEITPNYLDVPEAIPRMARVVPQARLFLILREPVDRAYSAYQLFENVRDKPFPEALKAHYYLTNLGLYAKHLDRVYEFYPRDRVKIFLYEDVQAAPDKVLGELYEFLEVNPAFRPPSQTKVYNHILLPRAQKLAAKAGLGWVVKTLGSTPLGNLIKKSAAKRAHTSKETLDPETARGLRQIFRDDVLQLQDLIGRDLSGWM